jgi:hypothetical protein
MTTVLIEVGIGILVQLLVAVFVYGRLTERVRNHGDRIVVLEASDRRHEGEIGELYGVVGVHRK